MNLGILRKVAVLGITACAGPSQPPAASLRRSRLPKLTRFTWTERSGERTILRSRKRATPGTSLARAPIQVETGQLPIRCSNVYITGSGAVLYSRVFPSGFASKARRRWTSTYDVSFFNGHYHIYYAFSAFGKNTSGIALVTNKTLDPTSKDFSGWTKGWSCCRARMTTSMPSTRTSRSTRREIPG